MHLMKILLHCRFGKQNTSEREVNDQHNNIQYPRNPHHREVIQAKINMQLRTK